MTRTRSLADRARDPSLSGDTTPELGGNLDVNGNHIVSTSNGNIAITPHGSGQVVLDGLSWPTSDGSSNQLLKTDGSGSLSFATVNSDVVSDTTPQLGGSLDVNGNAIVSASNGNIAITPNGSGKVIIDGLSHPTSDGSSGQFLKTDGSGSLSFDTVNTDLSSDSTPQLGGNLDVNGNSIVSASNGNISITPNGSGKIILDGLSFPTADGSADTVLKTDGSGNLAFSSVSALSGSGIQQVQDDTSPVLGGNLNANSNQISNVSAIAVGQSSFSGGGVLADFHASGSGVGSQLAFANDHNTSKFYVGLEGNTTGNALIYQSKDADINFYTNNNLRMTLDNSGDLILDDGNIILPQTGVLAFNSTSDEYITATASNLYLGVDNGYHIHIDGTNDHINFRIDNANVNGNLHYDSNDYFALESTSYLSLQSNVSSTLRSVILGNTFFKPFNADNGALDLGTSSAKWKEIHSNGVINNGSYDAVIHTHRYGYNNARNFELASGGSGADVGLHLKDAGSTASLQLYGTANQYGFLNGAWGGWDLQKQKAGNLYLNANTTYYLNPASTSILNYQRVGSTFSVGTTSALNSAGQIGLYSSASPYISFHNGTLDRTAYIQESGGAFYLNEATFTSMSGSARAPIFYDSGNTSYYCDPASWSTLYDVNIIRNLSLNGSNGTAGQVLQTNGANQSPTWVDAGGGAWEVIGNYTGTNVNSVDFLNGVNGFVWNNSTYKRIKLYGNLVGYSGRTVMTHFFPLVSNGSSGNVVPTNLVFYVTEFAEAYPEYNVSLTSSFQYIYQSNANNNNSGVMFQAQCGSLPTGTGSGIAMFTNSIGGTSFNSNKRKLDTTVTAEFDSLGLGTNKTFSWRVWVSHDYPSFYFYPRRISGETLSHGWTNQGIRVAGSNSSSNFNYDFTFLGLKP
ncbi:MAG: hypothetical protein CMA48_02415 [Euryarchaeota archaeon]|nr:hypothetical protein [Euryarchaeota archaeon]|tara:strand:- start:1892 stop:4624 length:2733 start_codon:yes stop_codon:yes gene_type:complete